MFNKTIITLAVVTAFSGCAQAKKATSPKSGSSYAKLVEASSQRTLPGIPDAAITTDYHIIIVWTNTQKPETFFWRGQEGWLPCNVNKAHAIKGKKPGTNEMQAWYTSEEINFADIKKGDTLEVTPVNAGKYPTPAGISPSITNTLFFKTAKTNWLFIPAKNIIRKKDIAMP